MIGMSSINKLLLLSIVLAVGGCASAGPNQTVELERYRTTALQAEPRLAVMIARNDDCTYQAATNSETCVEQDITPTQSDWFVRCVSDGFNRSKYHPDIRTLDADPRLRTALAQVPNESLLRGEVIGGLSDSGVLAQLERDNVSHVVAFAFKLTRDYRHQGRAEFDSAGSGSGMVIGVGGTSMDYFRIDFSASVIDVRAAALAGRIMTNAEGGNGVGAGVMIPILIPIPIPVIFPVFVNTDAREDSCEVLGNSIARFLYSRARPKESAPSP